MRTSGILLPISALPSPYGIGTLGKAAYDFVDFLSKSRQTYWQILPIGPTSYGDSPYQSFSCFAGNPYFIDLDLLVEEGLLKPNELSHKGWGAKKDCIDYGLLYEKRFNLLRIAGNRFHEKKPPKSYLTFLEKNDFWVRDYGLFMALKYKYQGQSFLHWDSCYRYREKEALESFSKENATEIEFWMTLQYLFFEQWKKLKSYANRKNVKIIGDIPIYVAYDSVEVWSDSKQFQLDEKLLPKEVAGCPPDGFSEDGQLWGNPLYNYDAMKKDGYQWWIQRISYMLKLYDVLRIDHFRGFDSYYAIPYGDTTARNGKWIDGPGMDLFNKVNEALGKQEIIAEDLGFLTDSVRKLLKDSGFPGMKVLEFAFDTRDASSNDYLPHNYKKNCVAYTGTHDNDTLAGWMKTAPKHCVRHAKEYVGYHGNDPLEFNWSVLRALWSSVADTTIVQAQDLLAYGSRARMNTPSTLGGNWTFRFTPSVFDDDLAKKLKNAMILYGRESVKK